MSTECNNHFKTIFTRFHNFHANLKKSCKVKKQIYFFMFFVKGFFLHQPVDLVTVVGGDGAFRLQQL